MVTRRQLLLSPALLRAQPDSRPHVACVLNAYFPNSHADVFMSRLLECYRLNGRSNRPRVKVVSLYVDQFPFNDMAREQAEEYGIRIYPTIAEALRAGGRRIAVDGVAVIGEHGNYPRTPRGNFMYPRYRHFQQITRVMEEDGRVVPLFNDKYLAYEWADAQAMANRVRELKIPFMAGSTLPLTWRRPPLEFPRGIVLDEALAVSFSDLEEHAYHGIELLQAMVERRRGGETGVARIRCVEGDEVWQLGKAGEWSQDLLDAALSRRINPPQKTKDKPQLIQAVYRDGLKASILNLNGLTRDYLFAARERGRRKPHSSCFYIQLYNHNHWSFMVRNFEDLVLTRKPPNPMERTLLANGILLFGLESRLQGQKWLDTPQLSVRY
ncbi:MAG: hypothetical protein IANPNBLG_00914 [Bryobacteraceae bacterium]|nr:hypothetical protein [Bryobacteraceae bacterium]